MIHVASYCRVSTDKDDQANSFESQQRFFREYILRQPEWKLYEVYADEGITGTSTRKRVQFNRMMDDAYQGKFDLIITKEVSRFSRNILDTIRFTRELKALGIAVIFMTDSINTMDSDAEMKLSLMASMAQEESRRTSARVKWGQTRQMERGVVFGHSMLGYDVKDGKISVNSQGAEIVRLIFQKYGIEKKGTTVISRELREAGYQTLAGNCRWSSSYIIKLLKNEKYAGDLVQKKTITPDFLTHAKKYNRGEEELVRIENHHEPIVSRELWNLVQQEMEKRNRHNGSAAGHANRYVFSGKIKCAECGASFVSRVKSRKDGTSRKRWCCFTAASEGAKRMDGQGNEIGCDIGKQISDELAMDILKQAILCIRMEQEGIIHNLTAIVSGILGTDVYPKEKPEKIEKEISKVMQKKAAVMDAYLDGDFTREEMLSLKNQYDSSLKNLQTQRDTVLAALQSKPSDIQLQAGIRSQIVTIMSCESGLDAFYKGLLNQMIVHKDGRVEVKLNYLPHNWVFQLEMQNNS